MTKEIRMANSELTALVDDDDFERMSKYRWHVREWGRITKRSYAYRSGDGVSLHRLVMNASPDDKRSVDHINHETLDCRKENLRWCSNQQNSMNSRKTTNPKSSIYKGVYFEKDSKKWRAELQYGNHTFKLGRFSQEIDAAKAYDNKAREVFGEFANPNF